MKNIENWLSYNKNTEQQAPKIEAKIKTKFEAKFPKQTISTNTQAIAKVSIQKESQDNVVQDTIQDKVIPTSTTRVVTNQRSNIEISQQKVNQQYQQDSISKTSSHTLLPRHPRHHIDSELNKESDYKRISQIGQELKKL